MDKLDDNSQMIDNAINMEYPEQEAPYSAVDIAHFFVKEASKDGEVLSIAKLMALCYYAEGAYLAINHRRLFKEKIVAWGHGPAIVEVYEHFKDKLEFNKGYKKVSIIKDNYRFNADGSVDIKEDNKYREATEDEKAIIAINYGELFGGKIEEDCI